MPLKRGYSQKTISRNIAYEMKKHPRMSPAQAAAIAYSSARESAPKKVRARLAPKRGR